MLVVHFSWMILRYHSTILENGLGGHCGHPSRFRYMYDIYKYIYTYVYLYLYLHLYLYFVLISISIFMHLLMMFQPSLFPSNVVGSQTQPWRWTSKDWITWWNGWSSWSLACLLSWASLFWRCRLCCPRCRCWLLLFCHVVGVSLLRGEMVDFWGYPKIIIAVIAVQCAPLTPLISAINYSSED